MHQSHVEEDMKYAYCLRPVVAGTVNINNPETVNEHMRVCTQYGCFALSTQQNLQC